MKLISLNTWGGKVFQPLRDFVSRNSNDTDVFCFQEVFMTTAEIRERNGIRMNLLKDFEEVLPNYNYFFSTKSTGYDYDGSVDFHLEFGIATFVKKDISVLSSGDFFEANNKYFVPKVATTGKAQYVSLDIEGKEITVCNVHGLWNGGGKTDAPERIEQSQKIKSFLDTVNGAKILCGDFNLLPDTESIKILEQGMKNLIKEYGVTSTRSHYYTKEDKYADYILVSPEIEIKDFKVLQDVVSDHLPLLLEFRV